MKKSEKTTVPLVQTFLKRHFRKQPLLELVIASRTFPPTARVDIQLALDKIFSKQPDAELFGVHTPFLPQALTIADLLGGQRFPVLIGPLQNEEIEIGEILPIRCLRQGLWLAQQEAVPFALLLTPAHPQAGHAAGTRIEIAVPTGEAGLHLSRRFFDELEDMIRQTASYRGKVISFEPSGGHSGKHSPLRVHKLRNVRRDEVILPDKTLLLLDRNIGQFVRHREQLRKLGLPIKKGLLFYGPPGTGKTHTIHYLAGQLPDHTTLLVTAEQVGFLEHYFQLARFLQPAMIVIEDVDLIARDRGTMYGTHDESLLNRLLNEMDGLREDAAVLFILTINRPENLERALASRPGRIDQAIEFPLPDANGRRLLVRLYACGLPLDEDVVEEIVRKTDKASAAFIKELMRRVAQFHIQNGSDGGLKLADINAALEEMIFIGGSLNAKLIGAEGIALTQ